MRPFFSWRNLPRGNNIRRSRFRARPRSASREIARCAAILFGVTRHGGTKRRNVGAVAHFARDCSFACASTPRNRSRGAATPRLSIRSMVCPAYFIVCTVSIPDNSLKNHPQLGVHQHRVALHVEQRQRAEAGRRRRVCAAAWRARKLSCAAARSSTTSMKSSRAFHGSRNSRRRFPRSVSRTRRAAGQTPRAAARAIPGSSRTRHRYDTRSSCFHLPTPWMHSRRFPDHRGPV